jgi:hypothetical protein
MPLTKLSLAGNNFIFPGLEIPAGEGKTANLFLQCMGKNKVSHPRFLAAQKE